MVRYADPRLQTPRALVRRHGGKDLPAVALERARGEEHAKPRALRLRNDGDVFDPGAHEAATVGVRLEDNPVKPKMQWVARSHLYEAIEVSARHGVRVHDAVSRGVELHLAPGIQPGRRRPPGDGIGGQSVNSEPVCAIRAGAAAREPPGWLRSVMSTTGVTHGVRNQLVASRWQGGDTGHQGHEVATAKARLGW